MRRGEGSLEIRFQDSLLGILERKSADAFYDAILSPKPSFFRFNDLKCREMTNLVNLLTRNVNRVEWLRAEPIKATTYLQNFHARPFAR